MMMNELTCQKIHEHLNNDSKVQAFMQRVATAAQKNGATPEQWERLKKDALFFMALLLCKPAFLLFTKQIWQTLRKLEANSLQKFDLGQVVLTAGVEATIEASEISAALSRHAYGDWGDLCAEDARENELALEKGYRLFSAYTTRNGTKFYIITEADRSSTTILLPEEY